MLSDQERTKKTKCLQTGGRTARSVILATVFMRGKPYVKAERRIDWRNRPTVNLIKNGLLLIFGAEAEQHPLASFFWDEARWKAWIDEGLNNVVVVDR